MPENVYVDWVEMEHLFPTGFEPLERESREKLFNDMNTGKKGKGGKTVSLKEATAGIEGRLVDTSVVLPGEEPKQLIKGIDVEPVIKLAYQAARSLTPAKRKTKKKAASKAKVDKTEFHAFLAAFKSYLKLAEVFQTLDNGEFDNDLLSLDECQKGLPMLAEWGVTEDQVKAKFKGFGALKYVDFADWIVELSNVLDLRLDDSDNEEVQAEKLAHDFRAEAGIENHKAIGETALANRQRILDIFETWDTDKKGTISESEMLSVLVELQPDLTAAKARMLFLAADTDKSGDIDYGEFTAFLLD